MVSVIADVLKASLTDLQWMERFGGMVLPASKPIMKQGADGIHVVTGHYVSPVACDVNMEDCWETGKYKYFEPDNKKSAIGFFMDNGGCLLKDIEGPKESLYKFTFDLKFLCWMNTARLGTSITGGGCLPSGRIAPYVFAQLSGYHTAVGKFGGAIEELIYQNIEVTNVRMLTKSPSMFEPFSFVKDGIDKNYFIYPYDYFGLSIQGTFIINKNCLPSFGDGWTPTVGCLAPPGNINWFSREAALYLAGRPVFSSNEDAKAGIAPDGSPTTALEVGDDYWGSSSHVAFADSFLRVV